MNEDARRYGPPVQQLVKALEERGLHTRITEQDGVALVRVYPPRAPSAGADLLFDGTRFLDEWGDSLGPALAAAQRVLWWFGKARP